MTQATGVEVEDAPRATQVGWRRAASRLTALGMIESDHLVFDGFARSDRYYLAPGPRTHLVLRIALAAADWAEIRFLEDMALQQLAASRRSPPSRQTIKAHEWLDWWNDIGQGLLDSQRGVQRSVVIEFEIIQSLATSTCTRLPQCRRMAHYNCACFVRVIDQLRKEYGQKSTLDMSGL